MTREECYLELTTLITKMTANNPSVNDEIASCIICVYGIIWAIENNMDDSLAQSIYLNIQSLKNYLGLQHVINPTDTGVQ